MAGIDPEIRQRLLKLARTAIARSIRGEKPEPIEKDWPTLTACGAFVTLRKMGSLRGCIGTFAPRGDVPHTIQEMAVSASQDPRFVGMPISATELNDITIEISLLSPLRHIDDPLDFELGKHGIYVRQGYHAGCFLPDVATESGWSKEQFLSHCCAGKAGMSADAWKDADTDVSIFTVEKFGD